MHLSVGVSRQCPGCSERNDIIDSTYGVHLGLGLLDSLKKNNKWVSVQNCVDMYFQTVIVDDFICETCSRQGVRLQKHVISTPEILHVGINLFESIAAEGRVQKPHFNFQDYSEISIQCQDSTQTNDMDQMDQFLNITYQLYGVIIHHGPYQNAGHYSFVGRGSGCASRGACHGKNPKCSSSWRHWDDSLVSDPGTMKDVLRNAFKVPSAAEFTMDGRYRSSPCILMYSRVQKEDSSFESTAPHCALCYQGTLWRRNLSTE